MKHQIIHQYLYCYFTTFLPDSTHPIVPLVEFYDFIASLDKDVSSFLTSSPATTIDRQHLAHRKYGEGIRLEVIFEYVDVDRVFDMARLKLLCRTNIQAHYGGIGYQFLESIR